MHHAPREMYKRLILVCVTALLLTIQFAQFTTASATTLVASGTPGGSSMVAKCDDFPGISNRIVKCVRTTLSNASDRFFTGFYPMISRAVTAFITLGVIVYGVMMAMGMVEKIGRDSIVLLLKIAFVAYFVQNTDMLYEWVVSAMDSLSNSMFSFSNVSHPTAPVCMVKASIWERLDCLMDTMFGIKTSAAAGAPAAAGGTDATSNENLSGHGLARGMIAFFSSALVSSVPGFIIGIIGFMFMYTMLFFLVKVLFTFLMSYMALLFLMILAPIFIPLVIFKVTKQYFDNWVKLIISCALQPVIIVTFVSFAVAGIDVAVFSGDKSFVRTIAGDAAKVKPFNLNEYIEDNNGYVDHTFGPEIKAQNSEPDVENTVVQQGVAGAARISECGLTKGAPAGGAPSLPGMVSAAQECTRGWIVGVSLKAIDWEALAEARVPAVTVTAPAKNKEEALMQELYASAILTAVMCFVMNALMKVVPQIANDLVGSYRQTPNMFGTAGGWKWQGMAGGAAGQLSNSMRQSSMPRPGGG